MGSINMFQTHESGKLPYLAEQGEHVWSYASIYFDRPWFHVTCTNTCESEIGFHQTFMLSEIDQLLEISQREKIKIEFVDFVSPPYLNETNRWKMESLKEIWLCAKDEERGQYEHIFVLEKGGRYSRLTVSQDSVLIKWLIFKI